MAADRVYAGSQAGDLLHGRDDMLQCAQESRAGLEHHVCERCATPDGPASYAVRLHVSTGMLSKRLMCESPLLRAEALTLTADPGTAFGIDFDSIFVVVSVT